MKAFFAENRNKYFLRRMEEEGFGMMFSERKVTVEAVKLWAFDNGAYAAWTQGMEFPEGDFLKRLDQAYKIGIPYLAVCPDIHRGGIESLEFSIAWMEKLPEWPWYLAVQDGITTEDVIPYIDSFSGIFIGGSNPFKATLPQWQTLGKPVHYGKCGTRRKIANAMTMEVDSIDSSTPLQNGVQYFEQISACIRSGDPQLALFE